MLGKQKKCLINQYLHIMIQNSLHLHKRFFRFSLLYSRSAYYRSQTSLDKGDKGIDFSLRLTKSDHVITLFCLCGFERKNQKKSFHLLLISLDKTFPGLPVIASAGLTCRQHRFALFSWGRATENRVTRSVFPKPQSHKNVIT